MGAMTERSGVTHPPELSESIGDALFRLARALDRDMAAAAEPEGLTPLLARILRNIGEAGHNVSSATPSASVRPRSRWRRASSSDASWSSARPTPPTTASAGRS